MSNLSQTLASNSESPVEIPYDVLAKTPLYDLHCALGARMVPFAGYAMPVQYPTGIISEHIHTRQNVGLFDISHMGQAVIEGKDAARALETLVPGELTTLALGQMRYTQLLNDQGNIIDDLILTRLEPDPMREQPGGERFLVVVNAATKHMDFAFLAARKPELKLTILAERALLALQGPKAEAILAQLLPQVTSLPFMYLLEAKFGHIDLYISRSGYTGEDGFEISIPNSSAEGFAKELLSDKDVWPIGLGARDSLRLEAGLCLYGHDIDETTNPAEAGLSWSIPKRRRIEGGFPGEALILKMLKEGPERRRAGFMLDGKTPAREGAEIISPKGEKIGQITSGGFSPTLSKPIAMGYVEIQHAVPGSEVFIIVRGKPLKAKTTLMPFVPHKYKRGI